MTDCPHCWTPEATARAAEHAARVAREVAAAREAWAARALLARLLSGPTDAEMKQHAKDGVQ
jgi:hypothetical protein